MADSFIALLYTFQLALLQTVILTSLVMFPSSNILAKRMNECVILTNIGKHGILLLVDICVSNFW